ASIGAVVESAVGADRPVDAVNHPHPLPREPPEPREIEVERVEQASRCRPGESVLLDADATNLQLANEGEQELVAAAVRRPVDFVEDGDVRAGPAGAEPFDLGPPAPRKAS